MGIYQQGSNYRYGMIYVKGHCRFSVSRRFGLAKLSLDVAEMKKRDFFFFFSVSSGREKFH